jgi:sulfate-transporting ATPase
MSMLRVSKIVPPKRQIIKDISLSFFPGAKIGLLGLNGSGKSTVLRIMAGVDKEYDGEVQWLAGQRIGYLPQEPELDATKTVKEEVESALGEIMEARVKLEAVYAAYAEPDADFDKLAEEQARYENILSTAGSDVETQMEIAADALRLPPWDAVVGNLSGGEKRRVALCKLLLSKPDMLLLDEPTNHLDAESVEWLEQFLTRFPGTVVAVTHDRYFLDNAAEWILELDRGHGIPWKGNYSSWLEQKGRRAWRRKKQEAAHQKAIKPSWSGCAPTPRRARPSRRRVCSASRRCASSRIPAPQRDAGDLHPARRAPRRQGHRVQRRQQGLWRQAADRQRQLRHPGGRHRRHHRPQRRRQIDPVQDDRGADTPDSRRGRHRRHRASSPRSTSPARASTTRQDRVRHHRRRRWTSSPSAATRCPARAYLGRFNFKGGDQQKMVGNLSGGERNRLHLAKTLKQGGNVLLLDEPSNDLDVETLRALEDALLEFAGCAMVISHDRWFLDRIATHILAAEGDSQWFFFEGNYQEYEEDKRKRLGEEGAKPRRIRYKPIAR